MKKEAKPFVKENQLGKKMNVLSFCKKTTSKLIQICKSAFKGYEGNKNFGQVYNLQVIPDVINRLIVGFSGSLVDVLSIFENKSVQKAILNDCNPTLIRMYKKMQEMAIKKKLPSFFHHVERIATEKGLLNVDLSFDERKLIYIQLKTEYNQLKSKKTVSAIALAYLLMTVSDRHSAYSFDGKKGFQGYLKKSYYKDFFAMKKQFLSFFAPVFTKYADRMTFVCKDAICFLNQVEFKAGDVALLDPPYFGTDANYNEFWTTQHERSLWKICDRIHHQGALFFVNNVYQPESIHNPYLEQATNQFDSYVWYKNHGDVRYYRTEIIITNKHKQVIDLFSFDFSNQMAA